jgi:hypothetical protein
MFRRLDLASKVHSTVLIKVSLCCRQGVRSSSCPDIRNPVIPDIPAEVPRMYCTVRLHTSRAEHSQRVRNLGEGRALLLLEEQFYFFVLFLTLFLSITLQYLALHVQLRCVCTVSYRDGKYLYVCSSVLIL